MKCHECGGELLRPTAPCPFCASLPEVDLARVNHRDLGSAAGHDCPRCDSALGACQLELPEPARNLSIEHCPDCHGLFFNPGEVEAFLHGSVNDTVWLDHTGMEDRRVQNVPNPMSEGRFYLNCPVCRDVMTTFNFGGKSGILVDQCPTHGMWLDGGELRAIAEWWHVGGKAVHQAHQTEKAARTSPPLRPASAGTTESPEYERFGSYGGSDSLAGAIDILWSIGRIFFH